jgi:putative peptidoglycan lipid II flippase
MHRLLLALYWPALLLMTHWPKLDVDATGTGKSYGDIGVDKLLHAASFGLLTALLIGAKPFCRSASLLKQIVVGCAIATLYAYLDESTQFLVERTTSVTDMSANLMGITLIVLALGFRREPALDEHGRAWSARLVGIIWAPLMALMLLMPGFGIDVTLPLPMGPSTGAMFELRADWAAHLIGGLGLTWLLAAGRVGGVGHPWRSRILAIALGLLTAPALETLQRAVGRGFEWGDMLSHEAGVLLACLLGGAGLLVARYRPRRVHDDAHHHGRFVGHALVFSGLTLVSRFTGLVRDSYMASVFGLGGVSDAFSMGFLAPNLFRRLFGEGALTAAFIPIYAELMRRERELATRFASACMGALLIFLGGLVVVSELILLALLETRTWAPDTDLAIRLTMVMLPYMPLVCVVALIAGILQVHGRFGPGATAPILLNLTMIGATALGAIGMTSQEGLRYCAYIVGVSVVVAGFVQLIWQLVALLRYEPITLHVAGIGPSARKLLSTVLPMLLGLAVFQLNTAMDSVIAFLFSAREGGPEMLNLLGWHVAFPMQSGAVAALGWAQRLYQFPLGVFGLAIATAVFPALSHAAADATPAGRDQFRTILHHGLRLTVFIGLPASVGLWCVRVPLARLIFEHGTFSRHDALVVADILAGYATAIWAYSMIHVVTRAFYAMQDSRTPVSISTMMVGFNIALNVVLIWPLGAAGLAWSTAVTAAINVALLLGAFRTHLDRPVDATVWKGWSRTGVLSALMAAALVPVTLVYDPMTLSKSQSALMLGAMVGGGGLLFLAGAWAWRCEELLWLVRRRAR